MKVEDWGFVRGPDGELRIGGLSAVDLARQYGTPLHVLDRELLRRRARTLAQAFEAEYRGAQLFYAVKCNSVAAVVEAVCTEGLGAEVMSGYELWLARRLGVPGARIIVNGPNKDDRLLRDAVAGGVSAIVVDSMGELARLDALTREMEQGARVLLRVNPDFIPKGMNSGSATGSRKGSVFGFDLKAGELSRAFDLLKRSPFLHYQGLHAHIGTGIRHPKDYARAFAKIAPAFLQARAAGFETQVFDYGGGFGVPTSKEFDTLEFLAYQGWGRLPKLQAAALFFAPYVCRPIREFCRREGLPLPRLYLEPGRSIASSPQVLLVTVGGVKERPGAGKWVITDGGAGTCAFPLYYEYHEVFLANDLAAPPAERVTLVGPVCFSSNWIYRNKRMPVLEPGDVLAIMDSGAYFLALEANFDFPRPAVVMVSAGEARLIRRREAYEEMASRDVFGDSHAGCAAR